MERINVFYVHLTRDGEYFDLAFILRKIIPHMRSEDDDSWIISRCPGNDTTWSLAFDENHWNYVLRVPGTDRCFIPSKTCMLPAFSRFQERDTPIDQKNYFLTQYGVEICLIQLGEPLILEMVPRDDYLFEDFCSKDVSDLQIEDLTLEITLQIYRRNQYLETVIKSYPFDRWKEMISQDFLIQEIEFYDPVSRQFVPVSISSDNDPGHFYSTNVDGEEIITKTSMVFRVYTQMITSGIEGLINSFQSTLTKSGKKQKDLLMNIIENLFHFYLSNSTAKIYAPYVSLIQSSGYGKSKITDEIIMTNPGISMVFRKKRDRGYPFQAEWVEKVSDYVFAAKYDDLPTNKTVLGHAKALDYSSGRFLLALYTIIEGYFDWIHDLIINHRMSREGAIETIGRHFLSGAVVWGFNALNFPKSTTVDIKTLITRFNHLLGRGHPGSHRIKSILMPDGSDFPFLIFLDELSVFDELTPMGRLSGINIIRRGLHLLTPSTRIMVMSIGTASDAWDFSPAVRDNSIRYPERPNLLPPIWLSRNFDIFSEELGHYDIEVTEEFILNRNVMKLLVSMGRSLWSSYQIDLVLGLATTKLVNGQHHSMESLLSYLLCRANIAVSPTSVLSRTLVRSHMASVDFIDSDARNLKISYHSEPIVAIASRFILSDRRIRASSFKAVQAFIQRQVLDRGRIVEVIHELLVLFAIDDSTSPTVHYNLDNENLVGRAFINPNIKAILDCDSYLLSIDFVELPSNLEVEISPPGSPDDFDSDEEMLFIELESDSNEVEVESFADSGAGVTAANYTATDTNEQQSSTVLEKVSKEFYHVIKLSDFVKSFSGPDNFARLSEYLPGFNALSEGYVNGSHFLNLENDNGNSLKDYLNIDKINFQIDRSLLKFGLIRQCAFVMPPNYPGIDFIVPILMKGVQPSMRPVYTYAAFQSKASMGTGTFYEKIASMDMNLHLSRCVCPGQETCQRSTGCITDAEFLSMINEQVVFLMSLDKAKVKRNTDSILLFSKNLKPSDITEAKNRDSANQTAHVENLKSRELNNLQRSFGPLLGNGDNVTWNNVRGYPKFKNRSKGFVSPDFIINRTFASPSTWSIVQMAWERADKSPRRTLTCFLSHDIDNFSHVIDTGTIGTIKHMVNAQQSIFTDLPDLQRDLVVDSCINGTFSGYSQLNTQLRASRNETGITDTPANLNNFNESNLISSINRCIGRNSGNGEPLN